MKIKLWFSNFIGLISIWHKKSWIRLIFVIFIPILITLFIFPYPKKITINEHCDNNVATTISYNDIVEPTLRRIFSEIFQAPLNLRWYNIYFHYNVQLSRGWILTKPYIVVVRLNNVDTLVPGPGVSPVPPDFVPNSYPYQKNVYQVLPGKDILFYYSGKKAFSCSGIGVGGSEDYQIDPNVSSQDRKFPEAPITESLITIYAKANTQAWFGTLILVWVAWSVLILLIRELYKFVYSKD